MKNKNEQKDLRSYRLNFYLFFIEAYLFITDPYVAVINPKKSMYYNNDEDSQDILRRKSIGILLFQLSIILFTIRIWVHSKILVFVASLALLIAIFGYIAEEFRKIGESCLGED